MSPRPDPTRLAVVMSIRSDKSVRTVEDCLHERAIDTSYETVGCLWNRFGRLAAPSHPF